MSNIHTELKENTHKSVQKIQHDFSHVQLIVGLGNVGNEYTKTRHNAGFLLLDHLATEPFSVEKKLHAEISMIELKGKRIILAKPVTMMNNSGMAVRHIVDYYKLWPKYCCVAFDDLDVALGSYKIQFGKGPKIHNGIASIETYLSSKSFWRIRIGVDNRTPVLRKNMRGQDYVLSHFNIEESTTLQHVNQDIIHEMTTLF